MRPVGVSTLSPAAIRAAERHLTQACAVMARLMATHGRCGLAARDQQHFRPLASSIMGQQLSVKAAGTIRARVEAIIPGFDPEGFLEASPEALRQAGLSAAKIRCVRDLAVRITDGRLDLAALVQQSDEDAIAELTAVSGIGRWTAEMFLIFGLRRPNVLALKDAGLRRAARLLYGEDVTLEALGKLWEPYCSVASWYLWRHLDATPQPT